MSTSVNKPGGALSDKELLDISRQGLHAMKLLHQRGYLVKLIEPRGGSGPFSFDDILYVRTDGARLEVFRYDGQNREFLE